MGDLSARQRRDLHEKNRLSWNVATDAHNSHKGDQAAFLRAGGSTLHREEIQLLGDLCDKSLVHLQCNAGQDTLSLARLGATVTGVDISDTAVEFARGLSRDSGIPGTFVRSDLYDWFDAAVTEGVTFDVAFSSYGALIWLSDIRSWGRGIESILAPRGRFVIVDFHPVPYMFDDDWQLRYDYSPFSERAALLEWEEGIGDYVAAEFRHDHPDASMPGIQNFTNPHPSYEFQWGIGDIVAALIEPGLRLESLREYPYSNSGHLPGMRRSSDGKWRPPDGNPALPLMYGISVVKDF